MVIIRDEQGRKHAIARLSAMNLDRPMELTIKPYRKSRSASQNALCWQWIAIIADELGYTKDEMHEVMAEKFLEPVIVEALGERIERRKSTTKLKVAEFTEYLRDIEVFAASELGIVLPRPEDRYYEAMGG